MVSNELLLQFCSDLNEISTEDRQYMVEFCTLIRKSRTWSFARKKLRLLEKTFSNKDKRHLEETFTPSNKIY